jgi:uroporphyrinogen decarboxylase
MISPAMFREFMLPRYRRLVAFFRERGVPVFMVDCDGQIAGLIPLWLEAGVNATYPCEIAAGNDPLLYRALYGKRLAIMGAIDKCEIRSKERLRGGDEQGAAADRARRIHPQR